MPRINTYILDNDITGGERFLITDTDGSTENMLLSQVAAFVSDNLDLGSLSAGLGVQNQNIPDNTSRSIRLSNPSSRLNIQDSLGNNFITFIGNGGTIIKTPNLGTDLVNKAYVDSLIDESPMGIANQTLTSNRDIFLNGNRLFFRNGTSNVFGISDSFITFSGDDSIEQLDLLGLSTKYQYQKPSGTYRWSIGGVLPDSEQVNTPVGVRAETERGYFFNFTESRPIETTISYRLSPSGTPTENIDLVTKGYLDGVIPEGTSQTLAEVLTVGRTVNKTILVDTDNTYNLGAAPTRFDTMYSRNVITGELVVDADGTVTSSFLQYSPTDRVDTPFWNNKAIGTTYYSDTDKRIYLKTVEGGTGFNDDTWEQVAFVSDLSQESLANAVDISISDTGNYYTGTNVEAALQELGAASAAGISALNQRKIDNARVFLPVYYTTDQTVDSVGAYITSATNPHEGKKVINTVEGANDVDFTLTDVGVVGDTLVVDNDGTGIVRIIADVGETFIGKGGDNEDFSNSERVVVVPSFSKVVATKKKDNVWRIDGFYTTAELITALYDTPAPHNPNNESSDVTMWEEGVNGTVTSSSTQVDVGTLSSYLQTNGVQRICLPLPNVVTGDDITVTVKVYNENITGNSYIWLNPTTPKPSGGSVEWVNADQNNVNYQLLSVTTNGLAWTTYTVTNTAAVDNPSVTFDLGSGLSLYVDNIVVTKNN